MSQNYAATNYDAYFAGVNATAIGVVRHVGSVLSYLLFAKRVCAIFAECPVA